jgi:hypothetical protein
MAAPAHRHAHLFPRGSNVLEYWLARAEGFTVVPLGGRVERVVAAAPSGRAAKLVVRLRSQRLRTIDADSVEYVDPAEQLLVLAQRPSAAQRQRALAEARVVGRGVRRAGGASAAGAAAAATWARPRAHAAAVASARATRTGTNRAVAATRWLAPRLVDAARIALIVGASLAFAAARLAVAGAREGRRALHARVAAQRLPP